MQFKVPQDVQRRDTIIWSLTIQQMIICGIGGGIAYAIYISLSKTYFMEVWLPPVAIISAFTAAFAFLKIHSLPFHEFLMNFIEYHLLAKQRFWIQGAGYPFIPPFDDSKKKTEKSKLPENRKPRKSLEELSKVLDTQGEMTKNAEKQATITAVTSEATVQPASNQENEERELSALEKKKGLAALVNRNYKPVS